MKLQHIVPLLLLCSSPVFAADANPPLGLQLESFKIRLGADVPSGLDIVKADGFTIIETAGTYKMTPEQFRAQLDAHGLKAVSTHFGYDELKADLPKVIASAKTLGSKNVIVAYIPHKGAFDADFAHKTAEQFNAWGKELEAAGIRFLYHPHGQEFRPLPEGGTGFDVLMAETDPRYVSYEMDVFWIAIAGQDPVALLDRYPTRWKMLHLKDLKKGAPTGDFEGHTSIDNFVTIGTGQISFPPILAEARKIGIEYSFIEDESTDPVGNVPPSQAFLNSIKP
ncbi:MAG TPA: sugar phosphate isomerase/epimerase [Opitutaceae bacterium]|jgi:sugar phosphate isomerase/epimerase|nr:sugar phosphate isomerase/epimerase [Opitutaceae bacterium]